MGWPRSTAGLFSGNMSDDAVDAYTGAMFDAMPLEVSDALTEEVGVDGREEALERVGLLDDRLSDAGVDWGAVEIEVEGIVGDNLNETTTSEYLSEMINERFGTFLEVSEGYRLKFSVTVTVNEDMGSLKAGESATSDNLGVNMFAIQVDNRWYLLLFDFVLTPFD